MFAAYGKYLRLLRNVCGLYEKCWRPILAPEEKCLQPMKNVRA
jgi:hypothetical protein